MNHIDHNDKAFREKKSNYEKAKLIMQHPIWTIWNAKEKMVTNCRCQLYLHILQITE